MSRITESFFKKLSQLNKIYTLEKKFTSTDDNFDFKLRIFFNKCKRVELSSHAYMKEATFMLAKRALFHFYDNNYENITFDKFRVDMKKFFEESEWKRYNFTKWQVMHIDNVIVANSNLSLIECLQKLSCWSRWCSKKIEFWLSRFESNAKNFNSSMQRSFDFIDRIT